MTNQTALTLPDPGETNNQVGQLADNTTYWLEQVYGLTDNESIHNMLTLVHENVQTMAVATASLAALTAGLLEAYQTTRAQLKQALHDRDVAIDEAGEAYANARDELIEDRQFRTEIECEIIRDLTIEASEDAWHEGYECGAVNTEKDRAEEIDYLYQELDRYKSLLALAGVEVREAA